MAKTVIRAEPSHHGKDGRWHYPRRCALCIVERFLLWLGVIETEED